jgi:NADH-quinone oxidoreductase subunit G
LGSFRSNELDKIVKGVSDDTKLVFIGTNGCESMAKADLILPTTTFFEKDGYYMNLEGRIQKTQKATTGPALVRDPFKIISILKKRIASLGLISHLEDLELTTTNLAERHLFF